MTRDELVDVLSVISVGSGRTFGRADVEFWWSIISDVPKVAAEKAVHAHFREKPGVWLEPGYIVERWKAARREAIEKETNEQREARQQMLDRKVAKDIDALAASKAIPAAEPKFKRPVLNPTIVRCDWCKASVGSPCVIPGTRSPLRNGERFHPGRVEAAKSKESV